MTLKYRLYRSIWAAMDALFPPSCAGCGDNGSRWCSSCQQTTPKFSNEKCIYCQKRIAINGDCQYCSRQHRELDALFTWGLYANPLRRALHRLKYRRDLALGEALARNIIEVVVQKGLAINLVVPVPLGQSRLKDRGYNQAGLLARPVAIALNLPYRPRAIIRIRETPTQVGLSLMERRHNVAGAFRAIPELVNGRRVLLVDDVLTTGATLNAAAHAVREAGVEAVYGVTVARAP